jgi:hypothetical protein
LSTVKCYLGFTYQFLLGLSQLNASIFLPNIVKLAPHIAVLSESKTAPVRVLCSQPVIRLVG